MKGRSDAARARQDETVSLAWHIEAIGRSDPRKRLPSLAKLMSRRAAPDEPQTADEMLDAFRAHQAAGAPMTIRRIH